MNRLQTWLLIACAGIVALTGGFALTEFGLTNLQAQRAIAQIDVKGLNAEIAEAHKTNLLLNDPQNGLPAILADAHRTELIAAVAITNIEKGTRVWQTKQNQIADQALADEQTLNAALSSVEALTRSLSAFTDQQKSELSKLESAGSNSLMQMGNLSYSVQTQLTPTLSSVAQSSANVADTTASIDASAHDIQKFVHRETSPVTGTWNTIKAFLREFAGPAASVATAVK